MYMFCSSRLLSLISGEAIVPLPAGLRHRALHVSFLVAMSFPPHKIERLTRRSSLSALRVDVRHLTRCPPSRTYFFSFLSASLVVCVVSSPPLLCPIFSVDSGVAMVFAGIGYEMRGKYQRHHAKQVKP